MFYRITASGSGPFPIDMLRFMCAWPANQADSVTIADTQRFHPAEPGDGGHVEAHINLVSSIDPGPHALRRWESFGWTARCAATRPLDTPEQVAMRRDLEASYANAADVAAAFVSAAAAGHSAAAFFGRE